MNISPRERRMLLILGVSLIVWLILFNLPSEEDAVAPVSSTTFTASSTVESARFQLEKSRATAARLSAAQEDLKRAEASLAGWEKRLFRADTSAQASAQLNTVFRRLVRNQGDAILLRNSDIGSVLPAGDYSEIMLNVSLDCQIEALLNLLTEITTQPELLSWRDLRVMSSDAKTKRLSVQLVVLARGPKTLLPRPQTAAAANAVGGLR